MIQDPGPLHNLGFGLPPIRGEGDETGSNPNHGAIAKALDGKPLLKFASVAVASVVGLSVAGKVARAGGYRLGETITELARQDTQLGRILKENTIKLRSVQKTIDEYQGVTRTTVDEFDPLVWAKRDSNGRWKRDVVTPIDGPSFRAASGEDPWEIRDELQRRLVSQARRLPYELPGFYVADKLLVDPLLGNDQRRQVNWSNPVDVIGDFAWESTKNIAFGVLPFEAATTGGAHAYRKFRTNFAQPGGLSGDNLGVLTTQALLEQLGVKSGDVINSAIKFSSRSLGAFSNAVDAASRTRPTFTDTIRSGVSVGKYNTYEGSFAKRSYNRIRDAVMNESVRNNALDAMPGPFKGLRTGIIEFGRSYKEIGRTYDDVQDVLSGRTNLDSIRKLKDGPQRQRNALNYMRKGGGSHLEQVADQLHRMGIKDFSDAEAIARGHLPANELLHTIKETHYKDALVQKMVSITGVSKKDAIKFVTHSSKVAFPRDKKRNVDHDLAELFSFSKNPSHKGDAGKWWKDIQNQAEQHEINLKGVTLDDFKKVIRLTDQKFFSQSEQLTIKLKAQRHLQTIQEQIIPNHVAGTIAERKVDFFELKNALSYNENYLVKNTAHSMGIKMYDDAGSPLSLYSLKEAISKHGIDPENKTRLLGYLAEKGVVKKPWQSGRGNVFGFSAVSAQEALTNGYFAGWDNGVQEQIQRLIDVRARNATGMASSADAPMVSAAATAFNTPGVYRNVNGQIIDVGRMKRSFRGALDALATETKIPILNMNPAQSFFYNMGMSIRRSSPIQFASKYSQQLVEKTGTVNKNDIDLYMFLRTGDKPKGKLFTLSTTQLDVKGSFRELAGEFKPFMTNNLSMAGRYSEIFLDSKSKPTSDTQKSAWKRLFHVDPSQESNIFFGRESLIARTVAGVRGHQRAYSNPRRAATRFGTPGFDPRKLTEAESIGLNNLANELKGYGFRPDVLKNLRDKGLISEYDDWIFDMPEGMAVPAIREALKQHLDMPLSESSKSSLARAQGPLRRLLNQGDEQLGFWDLPAPRNVRTVGVANRLEQLKSEFSEYLVLREGTIGQPELFSAKVADILLEVEGMYKRGAISALERTEARASVLSLQLQHSRNTVYDTVAGKLPIDVNKRTLQNAFGTRQVKDLFREYGDYSTDRFGTLGRITSPIKSRLAPAEITPLPEIESMGSSYTFVPTVGSAFRDRPVKTLKGLLGGTWNEPEAISSGSIYATHLAARLNKYFETVGLGLDLSKYNSPLDYYTRGLVGRRIAPAFIGGTSLLAVDRTLGGFIYEDEQGEPIHRPLLLGGLARAAVEGQAITAGIIPGGETYSSKLDELLRGEVPVRQGRYWLLNSNTPFKGGRIQYFRPSWYQRLTAGADYAPGMNETPMERLAFGYDFSPLRPLDPYRFERQNYESRPYPVTGDYFTGPWGPLTSILNQTAGRILKPSLMMHQEATAGSLASYMPVGAGGAVSIENVTQSLQGINASYTALAGTPGASSTQPFYNGLGYAYPTGIAGEATRNVGTSIASMYQSVSSGNPYPGVFAPMLSQGLGGPGVYAPGAQVVPSAAVQRMNSTSNRLRRTSFETQEIAGIYGFGFGSTREALGLGSQDFTPNSALLEPASRGYSASRSFWNLNLGGLGDMPLPVEGRFGNLEFSEIVRRFVPREQQGIQYINGIPNLLGQQYPWLPGPESMNNLTQGDPYLIPDAAIRLPGAGRDRVQPRYGSTPGGQYSVIDIHDILGDLDPFGNKYREVDQLVDSYARTDMERAKVAQTRAQREAVSIKNEFTPYKYKYGNPQELATELMKSPFEVGVNTILEDIAHRDTFINSKFLRIRTAQEDWERDNVYGATYPGWNTPYQSFIEPVINKSTQRNPFNAALATGTIGYLFGASARAKAMGTIIGGAVGLGASMYGQGVEAITGNRFIPKDRKEQLMLEENVDILSYMHSMVNASRALNVGDSSTAQYFINQSTKTMYGANLNATPEQLAQAVPSRKREHFEAMMYAPEQERERILSTAPRLERRLLQAAWGMQVEKLPDIQEYFQEHELPDSASPFWSPYTDMEAIKIKMGQHLGIDMAQMGFFPQQIQTANRINPAYPAVFSQSSPRATRQQLEELLRNMNIRGTVEMRPTAFSGGDRFELIAGIG